MFLRLERKNKIFLFRMNHCLIVTIKAKLLTYAASCERFEYQRGQSSLDFSFSGEIVERSFNLNRPCVLYLLVN